MAHSIIREHLEPGEGAGTELPLHTAIQKLRDEVTAYAMKSHGGASRELVMVMAKLDEARHWAVAHKLATRELQLVDRAAIFREAQRMATETSFTTETGEGA